MDIVVITLDLMYVHNFHCKMTNGTKICLSAVGYSFSMHAHNRKKDILFPGEDPTDGLDDNATTV